MKAFIGLWYVPGLLNWNNNDITFAYSQIYGNKIFNATMSIKRFQFLCENLHFDDISSRNTRFHHDRTAAIRDLFESFVRNCEKVMHPDVSPSLDETQYLTRVGVVFRQCNKDKPVKYGLSFRSINSAEVPYTYTSVIYAGKPVDKSGPYYVQTTHNVDKYLDNSLTREAYIKGYNLSTDRFYTSIEIANWLLEKKCNLCLHHQRKPSRNQEPKEFCQQGITKHKGVLGQGEHNPQCHLLRSQHKIFRKT